MTFRLALGLIVIVGLLVRVAIIVSPFGWIEADEAIVGLMARHILQGEHPGYYWGPDQGYLGALEAYSVAAVFAVFGSSATALKIVPAFYSLGFIILSALLARRLFGPAPGLITAAYLAVPPTMLLLWSVKARGGYAELLLLGEAVLLLTLMLATARREQAFDGALGLVSGLAFWTNPLAIVYLVPAAVYLLAVFEGAVLRLVPLFLLGLALGFAPGLALEPSNPFGAPAAAATTVGASSLDMDLSVDAMVRVGLPVLVGLGEPIAEWAFWEQDWPSRPGSISIVAIAVDVLLLLGLVAYQRPVRELVIPPVEWNSEPALLVLTAVAVIFAIPFSKFAELVAEPRYALPLYAAIPLYAGLLWQLRGHTRILPPLGLALVLTLNVWNIGSADPVLLLPVSVSNSTPENRAELIRFLTAEGLTEVYTEYYLAYPLAFESGERVIPAVIGGGPDRYPAYAERVRSSPRPAFVVIQGSPEAEAIADQLDATGAVARVASVSVYDVIYDITPPDALR